MNEVMLAKEMAVAIAMGSLLGVPAAQVVQAVRSRVPALSGAYVLVAVLVACAGIMALFLPPVDAASAFVYGRSVVFGWIAAVGTDALVAKMAGKVGCDHD